VREVSQTPYSMVLFVSGASLASSRAIRNVQAVCQSHLTGGYDLLIVDLHQNPELAAGRRLYATPTLLKESPPPERMMVGSFSDMSRMLAFLDLADPASAAGNSDASTGSADARTDG